jgi:hypothetical protein
MRAWSRPAAPSVCVRRVCRVTAAAGNRRELPSSSDVPGWLFDIVANKRTSVDVDKMDYLRRDSHSTNVSIRHDCDRIMGHAKVGALTACKYAACLALVECTACTTCCPLLVGHSCCTLACPLPHSGRATSTRAALARCLHGSLCAAWHTALMEAGVRVQVVDDQGVL